MRRPICWHCVWSFLVLMSICALPLLLISCAGRISAPYIPYVITDTTRTIAVERCKRTFLGLPWSDGEGRVFCRAGDKQCHRKLLAASWSNTMQDKNGFTVMRPLRKCSEVVR